METSDDETFAGGLSSPASLTFGPKGCLAGCEDLGVWRRSGWALCCCEEDDEGGDMFVETPVFVTSAPVAACRLACRTLESTLNSCLVLNGAAGVWESSISSTLRGDCALHQEEFSESAPYDPSWEPSQTRRQLDQFLLEPRSRSATHESSSATRVSWCCTRCGLLQMFCRARRCRLTWLLIPLRQSDADV